MNSFWSTTAAALAAALLVGLVGANPAKAAEKKEEVYSKTNFRTVTKSSVLIGNNHEIIQEVSVSDIKYSKPADFKVKEEWVYSQTDSGTGTQTGYYVDTHEDGSKTYGTFRGTNKTTSKPDGSWEATWEGTYQYVGGSGKFKNIKGGGKYKGRMSSSAPAGFEEGGGTIEY